MHMIWSVNAWTSYKYRASVHICEEHRIIDSVAAVVSSNVIMSDKLSLDNPIFWNYALYSTTCLLKMGMMAPMTGVQRCKKRVRYPSNTLTFCCYAFRISFGCSSLGTDPFQYEDRDSLQRLKFRPSYLYYGNLYTDQMASLWKLSQV